MNPIATDPYVEELHTLREQLAEDYHGDLAAYSRAAQAHCLALGFKLAESRSRRVEPETEAVLPAH